MSQEDLVNCWSFFKDLELKGVDTRIELEKSEITTNMQKSLEITTNKLKIALNYLIERGELEKDDQKIALFLFKNHLFYPKESWSSYLVQDNKNVLKHFISYIDFNDRDLISSLKGF